MLVCVAPEAAYDLYQFFETQFKGRHWEPYVISVDQVAHTVEEQVAAVVAHATDWPPEKVHEWLTLIRTTVGPRQRLLVILSRPPDQYPAETQKLWTRALGYGYKISQAIAIVDDFIAGRV